MIFVRCGLSIHNETVTNVDAAIGNTLKTELNVLITRIQFTIINKIGHKAIFAHLCFLRLINMISRNMPTAFGISPAVPPRHR